MHTSLQRKKINVKINLGDKAMAKKKKGKNKLTIQARRRLFVVRPLCLGFVLFVVATLISNAVDLYKLGNEKKQKEEEYIKLQEESEYLKNEIIKLHDPEYLAKFARENYSYSKDGELIIKIEKEKEKVNKVENKVRQKNEEVIIICGVGVGLIFIYLFIKGLTSKKDSA